MKAPFSLFLALRYLKPKRTFLSIITLISILGVTLGIMVLIVTISVMTGFRHELQSKILGFEPHIVVQNSSGVLEEWQDVLREVESVRCVVAAAPYVQGPVIAEFGNRRMTPVMRGIDPELEPRITDIAQFIEPGGEFDLSGDNVLVGSAIAAILDIHVGDKITIYAPGNLDTILDAIKEAEKDSKALGQVKKLVMPRDLTVTGIFNSGRYDYDVTFLLVPLHVGQELYGMIEQDVITGIAVKTADAFRVAAVQEQLKAALPPGVVSETWEQRNKTFFDAVAMERNMMFFLLFFIVIVAGFCIMNTLITVIVQKTREIGIMKALGATTWQIIRVFLYQGMVVGFFGNVTGLALGMTLIQYRNEFKDWLGTLLGQEIFPASIYQFSGIPAKVIPHDVAVICLSAFVACSLAALIPAWFAARLDPVKALRQE